MNIRAGRIGTKLLEYLGKDIKGSMGDSYPPKFKDGDVVNMELNKVGGWICIGVMGGFVSVLCLCEGGEE